jgi:catechol 2,3-dioxygenase-like lactoylglutathione lyase family enzyme
VRPKTLDHVALWTADRDAIAEAAAERLGMHVIERNDRFTLIGSDARRGKLTLFDAEGPRELGALKRIGLRVNALPPGGTTVELPGGLEIELVEHETAVDYDLDHVALWSPDPAATAAAWENYGFAPAGDARVEVGGAYVEFHAGEVAPSERPLLNHVGFLVDSVDEHVAAAEARGIEVENVVDAANTLALFVAGPDGVRLEYVEHKPSFSLT